MPFKPGDPKPAGSGRRRGTPTDPLKIEYWPIKRLRPYERNPRKNDAAVDKMAASIREFGFSIPILAKSDGEVVDGHLRLKGAVALKMESVPVIPCDRWSPAQVKAFRLMANRSVTWAEWDMEIDRQESGSRVSVKPGRKTGSTPPKPGPVPIPLDPLTIKRLAGIQCTLEEIAAVMGIGKRQFIDRMNASEEIREAIENGRAEGLASVRRNQFKLLKAGNATMGIWLGKQYLGQRDKIAHTGEDGGPIATTSALEILTSELARLEERERAAADPKQTD